MKLLQFTDTHIGSHPFVEADLRTLDHLEQAIAKEQPDMIAITGDLIWSDGVPDPKKGMEALIERLNRFDIPVFFTYGNHDSEMTVTRADLRAMEQTLKHPAPKTNAFVDDRDKEAFTVEILDDSGVCNVIYVFDSGNHADFDKESYDAVSLAHVDWFVRTRATYTTPTVDIAMLHIPLREYNQAGTHIHNGYFWDRDPRVAASVLNTGLFARLAAGGIKAIYCGHDHDNNFEGDWLGVQCTYGNVSGYNCYGELPRGYRVIDLTADGVTSAAVTYA